jgi:Superinfection immunity protein
MLPAAKSDLRSPRNGGSIVGMAMWDKWQCPRCGKWWDIPAGHEPDRCPRCSRPEFEHAAPPALPIPSASEDAQRVMLRGERQRQAGSAKRALAIFGALIVLAVVGIASSNVTKPSPSKPSSIFAGSPAELFICIFVLPIYFAPSVIAIRRGHPNVAPIVVINVLLGWTLVGYVAALAWSVCAMQRMTR